MSAEMRSHLDYTNPRVGEIVERDPYPEVEHQSRRATIFASKPGA